MSNFDKVSLRYLPDQRIIKAVRDKKGQVIKEYKDSDGDGYVDCILSYKYDKKGNKIEIRNDHNANGKDDSIFTYEYDDKNRVTYEQEYSVERKRSSQTFYEYDEDGRLKARLHDIDGDNVIDGIEEYPKD